VTKLNIKALCINPGTDEHASASSLIVSWHGKPFADPRDALKSFVSECVKATTAPPPKLNPCCAATLDRNPKAKACEACGGSTVPKKEYEVRLLDYIGTSLAHSSPDTFCERAFPYGGMDEDLFLGEWQFFGSFPADCDVVIVNSLDDAFRDRGAVKADYYVVQVGKVSMARCASGSMRASEMLGVVVGA
jgi:hypothetical protein